IGYGRRMRGVLATIDRFNSGARMVAVVDPRADELRRQYPDDLAGVMFYHDVDEMLDSSGVDGVLIGTRCSLHAPYAIKVLGDTELAHDFLDLLSGKGVPRAPLEAGILSVEMWLMARDSCQ